MQDGGQVRRKKARKKLHVLRREGDGEVARGRKSGGKGREVGKEWLWGRKKDWEGRAVRKQGWLKGGMVGEEGWWGRKGVREGRVVGKKGC